jgi:hypothetical protein
MEMEKHSRLLYVSMLLSVLLPYGVITYSTAIFSTNQQWLFPFWYFIHDFGEWLGFGLIVPVFIDRWYPLPLVLLGLTLFVLGLASSKLLHELNLGNEGRNQVILILIAALVSQLVMTYLIMLQGRSFSSISAIPVPIHTLIVLASAVFASGEKELSISDEVL